MHIAIIGAGIAGLTCAATLQARGHHVVVYEADDEVGGRVRTRQTELGGFDDGAQYLTVSGKLFGKAVAAWRKEGWVVPWDGRLATLDRGSTRPAGMGMRRLVAQPGMGSLPQQLARNLDVRTGHLARRVESHGNQWLLAVRSETVPVDASAGPFDAVIVATAADHAIPLLQRVPEFARQAEQARVAPCWTLLLGFQDSLQREYDGAWINSSRLDWICRDSSKPQRRPGEHWVAHAPAAWSIEHLNDDPARVKEKMLRAFHDATATQVQPVYAQVYLWRHANTRATVDGDYLWDPALRIGACGDWFGAGLEGGGRIENAYVSGAMLGGAIG
jgi:renalase